MGWSDRRYATEVRWDGGSRREGTYWLLGITVGVYALVKLLGGLAVVRDTELYRWFGVSVEGLGHLWLWQPLTYQFLHWDLLHLAFNMLALLFLGRFLESLVGTRRFVTLYLACGAAASAGCFLMPGAWGAPCIGASGSVMGILIIAAVMVPEAPFLLFFVHLRLKWLAAIVVGLDVLMLLAGSGRALGDRSPTAHWVHLAGALAGGTYGYLWPEVIRPRWKSGARRRAHRREVQRLERGLMEERELDRILDKINRDGMSSLSAEERRFLKEASDRYQESKRK